MVDNASNDGSVKYVKKNFPEVILVENKRNIGFGGANNLGVTKAGGEYLAFLNNDARVDKEWLREMVTVLEPENKVVCIASKILSWDGTKIDFVGGTVSLIGFAGQIAQGKEDNSKFASEKVIFFPCGASMLINKNVFEEINGFDESYFLFFEDVDLGWRLRLMGYKTLYAPKAIAYHRLHATVNDINDYKKSFLYERNALITILKNYEDVNMERILICSIILLTQRTTGITFEHLTKGRRQLLDLWHTFYLKSKDKGVRNTIKLAFEKIYWVLLTMILYLFDPKEKYLPVPKRNLANVAALDNIAKDISEIMKKRKSIQEKRLISDKEIFKVTDPFWDPFIFKKDISKMMNNIYKEFGVYNIFKE
tara:strand:- start:9211 stop:10308 length:1098 start_codon:yes stop_codon:yes gene_type:complete